METGSGFEPWDPLHHESWARTLGLVPVPLFGPTRQRGISGTVLLDGQNSSFAAYSLSDDDRDGILRRSAPTCSSALSWTWSSYLRHLLVLDPERAQMHLMRWDMPGVARTFKLPEQPVGAEALLQEMQRSSAPRATDVILHVLRAFRRLRHGLGSTDMCVPILVFNALLAGTEAVRAGRVSQDEWLNTHTIGECLRLLDEPLLRMSGTTDLPASILAADVGDLLRFFLEPEPTSGSVLDPELLLRHAAGQLYQEAHLMIEREQLSFPGMNEEPLQGTLRRDVRFTPPSLARALVEKAFDAYGSGILSEDSLEILDPACGSGVFLQEALRELERRHYSGRLVLKGFDISSISCAVARFCLERARLDSVPSGMQVTVDIQSGDALLQGWESADLVLMNPPFVPWRDMKPDEQSMAKDILGQAMRGRVDKAMVFISKGVHSLRPGKVVASVLPTPILRNRSGIQWRADLSEAADLFLIGAFQGYGYFAHSAVETGFIVMRQPGRDAVAEKPMVRVLLAREGMEDAAIRALRRQGPVAMSYTGDNWDILTIDPKAITADSWIPPSPIHAKAIERLSALDMPTVKDLFSVQQGALTGKNAVFILSYEELNKLPKPERTFFRRVANIDSGRIEAKTRQYVFYPYGEINNEKMGLLFSTEEGLANALPVYFSTRLTHVKDDLIKSCKESDRHWWALVRPRQWQHRKRPKLISKYFGRTGDFAFDEKGDTVVVQGYAWLWKEQGSMDERAFLRSQLPLAYLALLNSPVFESMLACFCPRVRGGQFNLSTRFVGEVYLPNLIDVSEASPDLIQELYWLGQAVHSGEWPPMSLFGELAAKAYRLPMAIFDQLRSLP